MNRNVGVIAVALLLTAGSARAVETGPYVGAFISRPHAQQLSIDELDESALRADTVTFQSNYESRSGDLVFNVRAGITAGWQFTRWLGIEGTYMPLSSTDYDYHGEIVSPSPRRFTDGHVTHSIDIYSLSAIFSLPITERLSMGARAGMAYSDTEVNRNGRVWEYGSPSSSGYDDDETYSATDMVPVYGANIEFALADFLTLRFDWHHFPAIGKVEATQRSLGYPNFKLEAYTFSGIWRF